MEIGDFNISLLPVTGWPASASPWEATEDKPDDAEAFLYILRFRDDSKGP